MYLQVLFNYLSVSWIILSVPWIILSVSWIILSVSWIILSVPWIMYAFLYYYTEHEAAAAAVGYAITTYKPSMSLSLSPSLRPLLSLHTATLSPTPAYVWSLELVPLFSELRQILDGLFKVTMSSLAFKLVEVIICCLPPFCSLSLSPLLFPSSSLY